MMGKPRIQRTEEIVKPIVHEQEIARPYINEPEIAPIVQRESFQSYKEMPQRMIEDKPMDYSSPYMNYQPSFKRPTPQGEPNYRYYPNESPVHQTMSQNYPTNPNFSNNHPYPHNIHSYQNGPAEYPYPVKNHRSKNYGNAHMNNMQSEEALNNMFRYPPTGYNKAKHPHGSARVISKAEMDEKILGTANMMKYVNNSATNTYAGQKIYNFYSTESGKPEENDIMPNPPNLRTRSDYETGPYDPEPDYAEFQPYYRGEYRPENNLPANLPPNLPAAYFTSKKFNFEGYFNTFEDDRFNEFADPKKKLKQ